MLLERELDVVLGVIDTESAVDGLMTVPMATVDYGIVTACVSKSKRIPKRELNQYSWILYGEHKSSETWLREYCADNDLGPPTVAVRTSAFSAGLQLVQSGGLAMIAPILLKPVVEGHDLSIVPVEPPIASRQCGAYLRPSSMGFGAVTRFLELLKIELQQAVRFP